MLDRQSMLAIWQWSWLKASPLYLEKKARMDDENLMKRLGEAAAKVAQTFHWELEEQKVINLYRDLLGSRTEESA